MGNDPGLLWNWLLDRSFGSQIGRNGGSPFGDGPPEADARLGTLHDDLPGTEIDPAHLGAVRRRDVEHVVAVDPFAFSHHAGRLLVGEDGEHLLSPPAELTAWACESLGKDAEVSEPAEGFECGRTADIEPRLDDSSGEHGLLEGYLDDLVGNATRRCLDRRAELLSQIGQPLGSRHRIGRLDSDAIEEQRQPLVEVTPFTDRLEGAVVGLPMVFEVRRQVEERFR